MRSIIQHYTNPLHIYCRLIDLKVKPQTAKVLCGKVEASFIYKIIYHKGG